MQCDQIRAYLDQYAEGSLPGYKAAWVVQHLAGCPSCTAEADAARQKRTLPPPAVAARTQTAATTKPDEIPAENAFEAVQRPIPRWLQWATAVLITAATGGAAWVLLPKVGAIWGILG